jgi:hypothetical protein
MGPEAEEEEARMLFPFLISLISLSREREIPSLSRERELSLSLEEGSAVLFLERVERVRHSVLVSVA